MNVAEKVIEGWATILQEPRLFPFRVLGGYDSNDPLRSCLMDMNETNGTGRTYRMRSSQRLVSIVLLAFGLFIWVGIWGGVLAGTRDPSFFEMMVPVLFSLAGALFAFRAFSNSVRFSDHAIELRGLSGTKILPIDKIKGRRRYLSKGDADSPDVWHLVLEPNDDRFPKLDIEKSYRFDEDFYSWLNALPDLDKIDKTGPKTSNFGLI